MARRSTIRSGTTKSLIYSIICIVAGGLLVFGGVSTWKNPADCGGQTMQQGDTCEVTDNGSTTDKSLSDQESSNHRDAIIMFVLGPLMIVGGGLWLSSELRLRSRRGAAPAAAGPVAGAGPLPGNGPQYPPQYNPAQFNQAQPVQGHYPMQGQPPYGAPVAQQQYPQQQYPPQQYPQQQYPQQQPQPGWAMQPQVQQPQQPQQGWPAQPQQQYPQQPAQPQQPGGWTGN